MGNTASGISRRNFLTGAGILAAGAAGAGLAGCSPKAESTKSSSAASSEAKSDLAPSPWGDYYPWPAKAPEISDDMVEEELDCDVAVVGMGVSGVAAFRAACEAGAKVIGIEKGAGNQCRSSQYCYLNGKLTDEFGLPHLDLESIIAEEFGECNYMTNYDIVRKFVYGDAEAMDWWIEGADCEILKDYDAMAAQADPSAKVPVGVSCMSDPAIDWTIERQAAYPECLNFTDHQAVLDRNYQKGLDASPSSTAYYGHFAEALIQDDSGRVVGVYARNSETGKYKKINAANGVCMASGCCRSNEDMVRYFAPNLIYNGNGNPFPNTDVEGNRTNTGDGYKMGYWAGAMIQQFQCSQMHVMGGPGDDDDQSKSMGFTGPLLRINYNGKRFMNEDTCAADAEYALELQPKHKCFMIADANFEEDAKLCVNTFAATLDEWDQRVGDGTIFKGNTLKELFESIDGMDVDAALATVEEYNKMCEAAQGADPQDTSFDTKYAKKAKYMRPVSDGPFYAQRMGVGLCLVMMGGLESNENAEVLDVDRNVIPGLYASGNIQGSRFVMKYPFRLSGHSHAMAMFYGKVAGENAAKKLS